MKIKPKDYVEIVKKGTPFQIGETAKVKHVYFDTAMIENDSKKEIVPLWSIRPYSMLIP